MGIRAHPWGADSPVCVYRPSFTEGQQPKISSFDGGGLSEEEWEKRENKASGISEGAEGVLQELHWVEM